MSKKKNKKGQKTYFDRTMKSWFFDEEGKIKIGDSFNDLLSGKGETVEVKEKLFGDETSTWMIVITKDEKIYLFKTSRELK